MSDFENRTKEYKAQVESFLKEFYARFHGEPQKLLYDAMEYSLLAGGKRLRPGHPNECFRLLKELQTHHLLFQELKHQMFRHPSQTLKSFDSFYPLCQDHKPKLLMLVR